MYAAEMAESWYGQEHSMAERHNDCEQMRPKAGVRVSISAMRVASPTLASLAAWANS